MAGPTTWQIHWQVPFVSLNGTAYTVSIYEWAYSGSIITLKGAPEPFITQEDDSEDIFTPVRRQTGSLRIVLDASESSYLEQLIPSNNTEKLIKLTHVENNATVIDWQGFMQTRMFTQPWSNNAHMIEFPLNGMLASLEHKRVPSSKANMGTTRALGVFTTALEQLGENLMTGLDIIDDCSGAWANVMVDWNAFFSESTENESEYSIVIQYGNSWMSAINAICETFGLIAREHGGRLVIAQYDNGDGLAIHSMTWATAKSVGSGQSSLPSGSAVDAPSDIISSAQFRGTDNQADYMGGAHKVEVKFTPVNNGDNVAIRLPIQNASDDVEAITLPLLISFDPAATLPSTPAKAYVQNFSGHVNTREVYTYKLLSNGSYSNATLENCINASALKRTTTDLYSGAWPCVWGARFSAQESVLMQSGLFLQQASIQSGEGIMDTLPVNCYAISIANVSLKAGSYINIEMMQHEFHRYSTGDTTSFIDFEQHDYINNPPTILEFGLYLGDYAFNGDRTFEQTANDVNNNDLEHYGTGSWVLHGNRDAYTFCIGFINTEMFQNEVSMADMLTYNGGFLIPITQDISGTMTFKIKNRFFGNYSNLYSRIISDLKISVLNTAPPYYSKTASNTYHALLDNSFKAEISKDLKLGTNNCNQPGPSLLLSPNGGYLKTLIYSPSTPSVPNETRPEKHLLARMANFYNATRHAYRGQILQGLDLWNKRWQLSNRIFMGIDSLHEWELDRQNARFIEVEEIQTS